VLTISIAVSLIHARSEVRSIRLYDLLAYMLQISSSNKNYRKKYNFVEASLNQI